MKRYRIHFVVLPFLLLSGMVYAQYSEYDWEERDEWMDIERILELSAIVPGDRVADVGCHEGYLSMHLARAVGPVGQVYAEDISSSRLERLRRHAEDRKLKNITTILGDETDPRLPDGKLDIIFVVDAYHEMAQPKTMLRHFRNALKPGGRIVILEKLKEKVRNKSRKAQTTAHSLSAEYVRKELKEAGFTILKEVRDLGDWEKNPKKKIWLLVAGYNGV